MRTVLTESASKTLRTQACDTSRYQIYTSSIVQTSRVIALCSGYENDSLLKFMGPG